jgi:hypothetical protein
MRLVVFLVCVVVSLLLAALFLSTMNPAAIPKSDDDGDDDRGIISNALEEARKLEPPIATSTESGDTEGSEWWLEHDILLRSAWKQWDDNNNVPEFRLPPLDASSMIDHDLRVAMDRTRNTPSPEHEAIVHGAWDEVLYSSSSSSSDAKVSKNANPNSDSESKQNPRGDIIDIDHSSNHHHHDHRVYRYPGFLTLDGIKYIRNHLDALSESGIPKRRPNAMNRNGLLLDPSVPGGISGDPELHRFVEILASDYLRPLGRSLFPEFAGDPQDDVTHYAFTIRYGTTEETVTDAPEATAATTTTATATTTTTTTTDWDLKEHSDASVYTLNINLNLPEEDYSGSSLYFVAPEDTNNTDKNTNTNTTKYCEVFFEPGTALLHRGMTKHGAKPLVGGKRNNLVIWLHGTEGYVRIAPYDKEERLSLQERWLATASTKTTTVLETDEDQKKNSLAFDTGITSAEGDEL